MKKLIYSILGMFFITSAAFSQEYKEILGSWTGKLDLGSAQLTILFNLKETDARLSATMDSPDQGAMGIEVADVQYHNRKISLKLPNINGTYEGEIAEGDSLIEGKWTQSGKSWDLALRKSEPVRINRPQEPKPPFPYQEKEVVFENMEAGISLAGTLTYPNQREPYPAVILITGSGSQNRDEELMGHKPFLVIADHFTRNGIAVLRFDDRGVGGSGGSAENSTSMDFASDVIAAFDFLLSQDNIIKDRIGLAGHSEGGLIAPIVASKRNDIGFIILMAGPGTPGSEVLVDQTKLILEAGGAKLNLVEDMVRMNSTIYKIVNETPDNKKAEKKIRKYLEMEGTKLSNIEKQNRGMTDAFIDRSVEMVISPWFRFFLKTDPADYLKQVKCPVLAINGSLDLQVPATKNLQAIEKTLKTAGNQHVMIREFPGLNHLFQHTLTGSPSEYSKIEETFSPEVLQFMTEWISSLIKK